MPSEITTKGIPHKKLEPMLEKIKQRVFKHEVIEDMLKKYKIDRSELDLVPMTFAKIPVSARTDHAVIYINVDLAEDGDFDEDDHYIAHELTHFCQQTTGSKPTPGSTEDNYLDNPTEQEGFRNQSKYIAETKGEEEAEDYIEQVLDHHTKSDADDKKRESRRKKLLDLASEVSIDLSKIAG